MSCTFSIIVTCYNHLGFLPQMIAMLEKQTFKDFEIIILDNASKDGSDQWIKEHRDCFAHVILNDTNQGLCKAFNKGVSLSKGKYLIDLSPDDVFVAHKLQRNYELLKENHLLFSDCKVVHQNGAEYIHSVIYSIDYKV